MRSNASATAHTRSAGGHPQRPDDLLGLVPQGGRFCEHPLTTRMRTTTEEGGTIATDVSPVCSGSLSRTEATPAWPHVPLRLVGVLWE